MLHADQRMKLFNFFLILSGLILTAFPAVRNVSPGTKLAGFLPMLLGHLIWGRRHPALFVPR